jgi:hypothetical protein
MRATDIAAAPAVSVTAPVDCQADVSEQEQVASAFVAAAIRLGRELPTERAPHIGPALAPYIGRHRRSFTVRLGAEVQAVRS